MSIQMYRKINICLCLPIPGFTIWSHCSYIKDKGMYIEEFYVKQRLYKQKIIFFITKALQIVKVRYTI